MPKLFVAIDLPDAIRRTLRGLIPSGPGIRPTRFDDLHLTLHYLGESSLEASSAALETLRMPAFDISATELGSFTHADGERTAWMGVEMSPSLVTLHRTCAEALSSTGFRPESRPYTPHISLARYTESAAALPTMPALESFSFPALSISLYSSGYRDAVARYAREWTLALNS